jgi:hypothetical protein
LAGILCNEKEIIKFASKDNIIVEKWVKNPNRFKPSRK